MLYKFRLIALLTALRLSRCVTGATLKAETKATWDAYLETKTAEMQARLKEVFFPPPPPLSLSLFFFFFLPLHPAYRRSRSRTRSLWAHPRLARRRICAERNDRRHS